MNRSATACSKREEKGERLNPGLFARYYGRFLATDTMR